MKYQTKQLNKIVETHSVNQPGLFVDINDYSLMSFLVYDAVNKHCMIYGNKNIDKLDKITNLKVDGVTISFDRNDESYCFEYFALTNINDWRHA